MRENDIMHNLQYLPVVTFKHQVKLIYHDNHMLETNNTFRFITFSEFLCASSHFLSIVFPVLSCKSLNGQLQK